MACQRGVLAVREFAVATSVGLVIGIVAGRLLVPLMRIRLPSSGLYPLRTLAACGVVYGVASVAHGSGFLAVFVAGILVGDERVPFKKEIESFHSSLASLAEVAAFGGLGLTIDITFVGHDWVWLKGLAIAVLLVLVTQEKGTAGGDRPRRGSYQRRTEGGGADSSRGLRGTGEGGRRDAYLLARFRRRRFLGDRAGNDGSRGREAPGNSHTPNRVTPALSA